MDTDPAGRIEQQARLLLDSPAFQSAVEQATDALASHVAQIDRAALHAGLMHAIATQAGRSTQDLVTEARDHDVPWKQLAAALGLSVSGVRTRFHQPTVDARQRYESQRQRPPRRTLDEPPTSDG